MQYMFGCKRQQSAALKQGMLYVCNTFVFASGYSNNIVAVFQGYRFSFYYHSGSMCCYYICGYSSYHYCCAYCCVAPAVLLLHLLLVLYLIAIFLMLQGSENCQFVAVKTTVNWGIIIIRPRVPSLKCLSVWSHELCSVVRHRKRLGENIFYKFISL